MHKEIEALKALKVLKDLRVKLVDLDHLDYKDQEVCQVGLEFLEKMVLLEKEVHQDQMVNMESKDHRVFKVFLE